MTGLSRHAPSASAGGTHLACDLLDRPRVEALLEALQPQVVIHAQALSDVDRCEREPQQARALNVDTTANLVDALERLRSRRSQGTPPLLIAMSSDYVFSGEKGAAYDEADVPNPVSVYGRSKCEAEQAALRYVRSIVVRTSTLFGPGRMNFCDHIIERLQSGQPVEAFIDQVTSPTLTTDLAAAIVDLGLALWDWQRSEPWPRVAHVTNAGSCSRVAFAQRVAERIGGAPELIRQIHRADQRRDAPRPAYSALTTKHAPQLIGRTLRSWEDALAAYLRQRGLIAAEPRPAPDPRAVPTR